MKQFLLILTLALCPLAAQAQTPGAQPEICVTSSSQTPNYNQLCMSASATGGNIAVNNFGSATGGLTFSGNPVTFPGSGFVATNYGASGSANTYTGNVGAGSNALLLTTSSDFKAGQGIWIPKAGAASTTATPTISGITVNANVTNLITFTGTPVAGQTLSVQFTETGLVGSPITISYTTAAGDTADWIAYNFALQVAANSAFNIAGIYATWDVYPLQNYNQVRIQQVATNNALTLVLNSAASVTLAQSGNIGASSTVAYKIIARDANGAFSAPTAVTNATSSNDPTLSLNSPGAIRFNRNPAFGGTNAVKWTNDGNAIDILVCRNNVPVAIVPAGEGTTSGFIDEGQFDLSGGWLDAPSCTATLSQPAPLITTVSTINGSAITLASPTVNAVTSGTVAHDDGAAIQAMLNAGCHRPNGTGVDGYMVIPVGNYNIHQTLTCIGGNGSASFIQGQGGMQRIGDRSGTFISYYGRGDSPILHLDGVNGSTLQDFLLYGNYIAKWALQVGATGFSISGDHYNRIGLWRPNMSADSAGAMFGGGTILSPVCIEQLSEQFFQALYIFQDIGSHAGLISNCGGNQKNFTFLDLQIVGFHIGVSGPATGVWSFKHTVIGNVADTLFSGISNLDVDQLESESLPNARLASITGSGNSFNFQHFNGVGFNTPPPSPGFFVLEVTGMPVIITNSIFGAGTYQGEYRMNGSFSSAEFPWLIYNNFFEVSAASLPLYVGGNRQGTPPTAPNDARFLFPIGIVSKGNTGGPLIPSGTTFLQSTVALAPTDLLGGSRLLDQIYLRQWLTNAATTPTNAIDMWGSGIRSRAMVDPTAPTITVLTSGVLTCVYQIAFRDAAGQHTTALSATATTNTCASPRNNRITSGTAPQGAYFMDVVDNASGMLVGTVNLTQTGVLATGGQNWVFTDVGQSQTAYSPPAAFNNTGTIHSDRGVITTALTVATLPTCGASTKGMRSFVTDQNTAVAYHGAVTGGGSNQQGVTCDGTAWYQD